MSSDGIKEASTAEEGQVEVGSVLKIRWPSVENGNFRKFVVVKKKTKDGRCQYKVQAIDNPAEIVKVKLSKVEWKFAQDKKKSGKRKHQANTEKEGSELDHNQLNPSPETKRKKSKSALPSTEIVVIPKYSFKRQIPPVVLKYILAPMVGASELAFRLLCRRYGATLAYTPMMNSERFAFDENYRKEEFQTNEEDRPLVAHFCANNPEFFLKAVQFVQDHCDAIDLNLGCPQRVAYSGHFGSFLLDEVDRPLVLSLIRIIADQAKVPIFAKIRLLDTVEDTIRLCRQLIEAGTSLIAIHGRYRVNLVGRTGPGARDGPAHLDQIQQIRQVLPHHIPVIANGNIITWEDVQNNLALTQCQGVMSAEGILDNPALFHQGIAVPPIQLAKEYLALVTMYPVKLKTLIFHIRRMCRAELTQFQLMEACLSVSSLEEMQRLVQRLEQYLQQPDLFHYDQEIAAMTEKRLAKKKQEESKRKLFEERMIRKAKREGLSNLFHYLEKGAEIPTVEIIQQLKSLEKEEAFKIWKERYSQHCWNYHFHPNPCERDRSCAFLHMDPRYLDEKDTVFG